MSNGTKVVTIILGIAGVLLVIMAGVGVWAWKTKGAQWTEELREVGVKEIAEARQAGANATKQDCLQLAIARLQQDQGFMGQVKAGVFTQHCLDVAKGELPYCADAPPMSEIIKTAAWGMRVSEALGLNNANHPIVRGVHEHCVKPK